MITSASTTQTVREYLLGFQCHELLFFVLAGDGSRAVSTSSRPSLHAMQQSTVKWFDAKKGYGFINHPEDGEDVFVHYSNIQSDDDFKTLRTGQDVKFEMNDGPKGLHALNVVALDEGRDSQEESTPEITPADVDPTAEVDPSPSEGQPSSPGSSL